MASRRSEILDGRADGMLDLEIDPKLAWALRHRAMFPVDVNRADREVLLRVPGLGAKVVDRILETRRHRRLRLEDVGRLCQSVAKVRPFIVAEGWSPGGLTDQATLREKIVSSCEQIELVLMQNALLDLSAHTVHLASETDFAGWRDAARRLALAGVRPEEVAWEVEQMIEGGLPLILPGPSPVKNGEKEEAPTPAPPSPRPYGERVRVRGSVQQRRPGTPLATLTVAREFVERAETVFCHSDPERFALLYRMLWRMRVGAEPPEDRVRS